MATIVSKGGKDMRMFLQQYEQEALMFSQDDTSKKIKLNDCMTDTNEIDFSITRTEEQVLPTMVNDMTNFLETYEKKQDYDVSTINQSLNQLQEELTNIRTALEQHHLSKKKRITLWTVNEKLDQILVILNSWNYNTLIS